MLSEGAWEVPSAGRVAFSAKNVPGNGLDHDHDVVVLEHMAERDTLLRSDAFSKARHLDVVLAADSTRHFAGRIGGATRRRISSRPVRVRT